MKRGQTGFTVVETLLVLILLVILAFAGLYVARNGKSSGPNSPASSTTAQKLLAELKSTKATAYNWDFKMYEDGSGSASYQNTPSNTRPLPKDQTYPAHTFNASSFQQQLNTLNPDTYTVDTTSPTCSPEDFEIIYKGHTFNNIQCYIGFTQNHAAGLGSQISKIFNIATDL